MQRPGARQRETLLLTPGEDARRALRQAPEPDFRQRIAREAKGACAALIFCRAATISLLPPTLAGSDFGPTRTKSLYITSKRRTP